MEQEVKEPWHYHFKSFFKYHWRGVVTIVVPIIFLPLIVGNYERPYRCLYVVCVMALLWITEVLPLYITGLIPIFALPLLGIMDSNAVAIQYFKDPLVVFVASIMVALSIEYCNLHRRLALGLISLVGVSPKRMLGSIIFLSGFTSMWFQNTAVAASMCPIVRAILAEFESQGALKAFEDKKPGAKENELPRPTKIAMAYYLSIAYGATMGGCATLIGTGTNLTFKGIYESRFPKATDEVNFTIFLAYNFFWVWLDLVCLFFIISFLYLGMWRPNSEEGQTVANFEKGAAAVRQLMKDQYKELGPMTLHEIQVTILFLLMVCLLFFRNPGFMPGWASLLPHRKFGDSFSVVLVVVLLFYLPAQWTFFKYCCGRGPFPSKEIPSLMSWTFIHENFPWGLIFLLGGGFALASASTESGMAKLLAEKLKFFEMFPREMIQFSAIFTGCFFTAFSSNVAICNILVPVMAEIAVAIKVHPLDLIYPSGMACSIAFLLPVSTPPNAIIVGYANIRTKDMIIAGLLPTLFSILLLFLTVVCWHTVIYPNTTTFPSWATESKPT